MVCIKKLKNYSETNGAKREGARVRGEQEALLGTS
jgi:hypothetical protein